MVSSSSTSSFSSSPWRAAKRRQFAVCFQKAQFLCARLCVCDVENTPHNVCGHVATFTQHVQAARHNIFHGAAATHTVQQLMRGAVHVCQEVGRFYLFPSLGTHGSGGKSNVTLTSDVQILLSVAGHCGCAVFPQASCWVWKKKSFCLACSFKPEMHPSHRLSFLLRTFEGFLFAWNYPPAKVPVSLTPGLFFLLW